MAKKKPVNSRRKGARAEVEGAKYLCRLGFDASRNARNGKSEDDLDLSRDPLLGPNVHIEVKRNNNMTLHSDLLAKAMAQAINGCGGSRTPFVLWRRDRHPWYLTFRYPLSVAPEQLHTDEDQYAMFTCTGDENIRRVLRTIHHRHPSKEASDE